MNFKLIIILYIGLAGTILYLNKRLHDINDRYDKMNQERESNRYIPEERPYQRGGLAGFADSIDKEIEIFQKENKRVNQ